jgi:hypothetical protein
MELAGDCDVDGVLPLVTLGDIADAWCQWHELPDHERKRDDDPRFWAAYLWMTEEWWADERRVRDGLLAIVERATSEWVLECVGAGPLEQLVCDDESCIRWIEAQAARSFRFRDALSHVWIGGDVSHATFLRIEAAVSRRLDNPRRDAIEGRPPPGTP